MSGVALWVVASSADAYLAPFTVIVMFIAGVAAYLLALRLGGQGNRNKSTPEVSQ
jgi:hypothetical protein